MMITLYRPGIFLRIIQLSSFQLINMKNNKTIVQKNSFNYPNQGSNYSQPVVTATIIEKTNDAKKVEQQNKLIRRYSFDDNGGSYLGL